jgi:hypothetical protein
LLRLSALTRTSAIFVTRDPAGMVDVITVIPPSGEFAAN